MICQECEYCERDAGDLCLYTERKCYDGCDFCQTHNYCKFEGE